MLLLELHLVGENIVRQNFYDLINLGLVLT